MPLAVSLRVSEILGLDVFLTLVEVVVIIRPYKAQCNYDAPSTNTIRYPNELTFQIAAAPLRGGNLKS